MLPSIIFVLALSFPFSVAAVPPRRDETLHIPLLRRRSNVRRDSDGVDLDHYAAASSALRQKYGFGSSSPSRRAQTTDLGITNQVRLSSATDSGIHLTLSINNTTRAPIQVTLPKSASAPRECETLWEFLCFTLLLIVFRFRYYFQSPEIQSRPRHGFLRFVVCHLRLHRLQSGYPSAKPIKIIEYSNRDSTYFLELRVR
jgi:hypothetical protein